MRKVLLFSVTRARDTRRRFCDTIAIPNVNISFRTKLLLLVYSRANSYLRVISNTVQRCKLRNLERL